MTIKYLRFVRAAVAGALFSGAILAQIPTITSMSPNPATSGGNLNLTLTGTGFCVDTVGPNDIINFNGSPNTAATNSATSSSAMIPAIGNPAVASPTNIPVHITTAAGCAGGSQTSANVNILMNPPLVVGPPSLPGGAVGSPYSQVISSVGGTPPYGQPNIATAPNAPPHSVGPGTFTINFTPGSAQTYAFQLIFSDSGGGNVLSPAYVFQVKTPSSASPSAGSPQATTVARTFGAPLQVLVLDAAGSPVEGAKVTFTAPAIGASGTFPGPPAGWFTFTDPAGHATPPPFTANTKAGSYNVTATVPGVATPAIFSLTNLPDFPSNVTAVMGTPQSTAINTNFPVNLQALVTDSFGNPELPTYQGQPLQVTFVTPLVNGPPLPSGTFSGNSQTIANVVAGGTATASALKANGLVGSYQVQAFVTNGDSGSAFFNLTNTPGVPGSISATGGTPQTTAISTAFGATLQATVLDTGGNPVSGATVTFTAPGSGASGTFAGSASVLTNSSGVATSPVFTANSTAGSYAVNASVTGVATPAAFSLTNTPSPPATITTFAGTPQVAVVKTAFSTALSAVVKDSGGNGVPNVQVSFAAPPAGATGTFAASALVTTGATGVATAPTFTANQTAGSYIVTASVSGLANPANFNLTNSPGTPALVSATGGTPQTAVIDASFGAALQATVTDAFGNPVPNIPVTFTIPPNTPGSALTPGATFLSQQGIVGTLIVVTNASGVATTPFIPIADNIPGTYNGTATVAGVAAAANFVLTNTVSTAGNNPNPAPTGLSITTTTLPPGTVGIPYGGGIGATGGTPPYFFTISGLPAGLISNGGSISGTPQSPGTATVTAVVSDTGRETASRSFSLAIAPALIITTGSPLPNATLGQGYSITIQATGGRPPYSWSISGGAVGVADDSSKERLASAGGLPGFTFSSGFTSATLSGTPAALGNYSFAVQVTDLDQRTAFKSFSLTTVPGSGPGTPPGAGGPPAIQISQTDLNFDGPQGGNTPPPQYISIVATNQQPLVATIQTDSGAPGTPAPPWLNARFVSATTPARLAINTTQSGLAAGSYKGRVVVRYQGAQALVVNVSFTINLTPPKLNVAPGFLRFAVISGVTGTEDQALLVSNSGTGGPLNFTAAVTTDSPWVTVAPASAATVVGGGVPVRVTINPQGLKIGSYLANIHVASALGGSVDVPVSLFVSPNGPIITLNPLGVRFDARAGNGLANPRQILVLNTGTGAVNWSADLMAGQSWLSLSPASGQSTPSAASQLQASANSQGLQPGALYGLIRVSDPNALNSPQYAIALLNVVPASSGPDADLAPSGLYFTASAGAPPPVAQKMKVFTSSDTPYAFQAAASSDDGANWLSIDTLNGTASTKNPAQITVSVNAAGLKPGVYTGDVSVSFSSQTIRTANVTLVVLPQGVSVSSVSSGKDRAAGCAPTRLSLTSTSLPNAFASPAGWPTPLIVRATDDCGAPASGAQVVATFSNGDPPLALSLTDPTAAQFSGTWAPNNTAPQMTITVNGLAAGLSSASANVTGTVGGNTAPSLSTNSTVNNLNPTPGAALAPGTVAQIYGGALTPSTSQPGLLPLPTAFNNTSVLIGAYLAPLYYLSDGQLNIQIPTELTANRQYSMLVSSGAAFTLPDTLTVTDVSPGLLNFAQHADFSTISASSPAKAGETVLLYLVGMGATTPSIASGTASPAAPAANVAAPPAVTINGESGAVSFAGLTPGLVGLYQVNVQLPADTTSGAASVTVTQNGVASNTVTIPVQ